MYTISFTPLMTTTVTITNVGAFYTDTPSITFTGGAGADATAVAVMDNASGDIEIAKATASVYTLIIDIATPSGL